MESIDRETGEILTPQTVYLRSSEFVKVIDPNITGGHNAKFVKMKNGIRSQALFYQLSCMEAGFLAKIAQFASRETNILTGNSVRGSPGLPLKINDLCKLCGVSKPTGIKIIKSLVEKKILAYQTLPNEAKAIAINPEYFLNGRRADVELLRLFSCPKADE